MSEPFALSQLAPAVPEAPDRALPRTGGGAGFAETLGNLLNRVGAEQSAAEREAAKLVAGDGDIVDTMIAMGRAEVSMRYVVTLRDRAVEAYQEIMRLSI